MAGEDRSSTSLANPAVQSCWLCGTRLPAREMVADGGSACADLRWYCADTRRCTERWTSHWSTGAGAAHGRPDNGRPDSGYAGNGHAGNGFSGQGLTGQGRSPLPGQGASGLPGQGAGGLPGQGRGTLPDPRGRQLAGLGDRDR
jgi:hypothetical protein